uniref:Putative spliceosomal protein fbp21 n=1 Tax=Hyalomma excavatum TaxID=257692 RepID=A0A131XLC2_9ACAR
MADYWKSQPKKFCEACKCWFADNKASIDFHEKGKNHQANVQKRITEIMKKGKKMQKAQQNYENIMDGINQAALQAFQKDVKSGGSQIDAHRYAAEEAKLKQKAAEKEQASLPAPAMQVVTWFEGVTEGGDTYYWNMETGESSWEKPDCDYVPLSNQQEPSGDSVPPEEEPDSSIGPAPKASPYGEWQEVRPKQAPKIDLQLPQKPEGVEEVVISVPSDVPTKVKFTEKTVGSLESEEGEDASSVFKKRKFGSHSKRNVRQRTDDD